MKKIAVIALQIGLSGVNCSISAQIQEINL